MADKKNINYGGIAAVITAIATLVGAIAIFYPKGGETESKPPETVISKSSTIDNDNEENFCTPINNCILDVPNNFENIKGEFISDQSSEEFDRKLYMSKATLPNTISNTVTYSLQLETNDLYMYFNSVIVETENKMDANIAYQQWNKKLTDCLTGHVISKESEDENQDGIPEELATYYRLNGVETSLEFYSSDGFHTVEIIVSSYF